MLVLWRKSEKPAKTERNAMISAGSLKNSPTNGIAAEQITDASETNPVRRKMAGQEIRMINTTQAKCGTSRANEMSAPKLVAIPLPPLKPRNIVQLWPATTVTAARHK